MGEMTVQGRIHTRRSTAAGHSPIPRSPGYGPHREPIADLGICWIKVHTRQA
jgi:hypothetical protein